MYENNIDNLISDDIDELYLKLGAMLLGFEGGAEKVGNTIELNNVKLTLTDITKNIVSIRNISPSYLFGELLWYFNGDDSLKFISQFSSFWNNISDDGETCNSAYGKLILTKYGFNQMQKVIDLLRADPNSRRAKININVPNKNVITTKDEPCTMSLHFIIRDSKLNCTAVMRSNDIWFGFPYDVAFFTELQKMIAERLHVGYGIYTHFAVSLHVYDRDINSLGKILKNPISKPINFNRAKFIDNIAALYNTVLCGGKWALMKELNDSGIYQNAEYEKKGKEDECKN